MGERSPTAPIVIVDDDSDALFLLTRLLAKGNVPHPVITFKHPEQALRFFERALPGAPSASVVFCDVRLPAISGFDLVTKLRAIRSMGAVSIWMMSSSGDASDVRRALRAGANGYLIKYPPYLKLLEIIERAGRRDGQPDPVGSEVAQHVTRSPACHGRDNLRQLRSRPSAGPRRDF
jgi:CheY-like chemotaxis protein